MQRILLLICFLALVFLGVRIFSGPVVPPEVKIARQDPVIPTSTARSLAIPTTLPDFKEFEDLGYVDATDTPVPLPTATPAIVRSTPPADDWLREVEQSAAPSPTPVAVVNEELPVQGIPPRKDSRIPRGLQAITPSADEPAAAVVTPATPTPTPTPAGSPRVQGQARGYTMLALMEPRAQAMVERQVANMLNSEVQDLYLGVLVDGTFSVNMPYLENVVTRLNTGGRSLLLVAYLSNGSTMRRYDMTQFEGPFNRTPPDIFRMLITSDRPERDKFHRMALSVRPVFELNRSLNERNRNIAIVMLEDNLDAESYRATRSIAGNVLSDVAEFVRNPCPGCYPGNDTDTQGDGLETHEAYISPGMGVRDGITLDGVSYIFPGEIAPGRPPIAQIHAFANAAAAAKLRYFGLWRAERQGLGSVLVLPSARQYEVATEEQSAMEIDVLRSGLTLVEENAVETQE